MNDYFPTIPKEWLENKEDIAAKNNLKIYTYQTLRKKSELDHLETLLGADQNSAKDRQKYKNNNKNTEFLDVSVVEHLVKLQGFVHPAKWENLSFFLFWWP